MEKKVFHNSDRTTSLVIGVKTAAIVTQAPPKRATSVLIKTSGASDMVPWGENNDFPQKVIEAVRKDSDLGQLLSKAAKLLVSGGLSWGIPEIGPDGEEILKPLSASDNQKVKLWMRQSNINRYLIEAANDLERFYNGFAEFVLSLDRKQIVQVCVQAAENCRFSKMGTDGKIKNCYISANFPDAKETDPLTKKIPVLDPYFNPAVTLAGFNSGWNFIYPISYPTPGASYYQLADWNGLIESGWLALSQIIPKIKLSVLEKINNIKYHVEISNEFWPLRFPDWESLTPEEKDIKVNDVLQNFSDVMSGVEGAGNSLITAMRTDSQMSKEMSMWKITVIDNKIGKGEFLEELQEAALVKAYAVGIHPALAGSVSNSGMGGAGSNIREAYNLTNVLNKPHQEILLEPLYVVRDFNKWNPEMEFRIRNPFMTTLNTGKEMTNTKPA